MVNSNRNMHTASHNAYLTVCAVKSRVELTVSQGDAQNRMKLNPSSLHSWEKEHFVVEGYMTSSNRNMYTELQKISLVTFLHSWGKFQRKK